MTLKPRADFWSVQGDFIYRHHNEPRVQLYVPKDETFSIPLKSIDVTSSTHVDLDVMQQKRIDDYWNVDSNRSLSDSWRGFTKFTLLKENSPKKFLWSGRRLTKVQTTTRPDRVWPKVWTKIGKAAQNREKQEWKNEKPKLDNAPRLRWIYFTDPRWRRIQGNPWTCELGRPMAAAMPCKKEIHSSHRKLVAELNACHKVPHKWS